MPIYKANFPRYPSRILARELHATFNKLFWDTINVNEFPKSGGTWLSSLIAESVKYDFNDNKMPRLGNSVIKHHRMRSFTREVVMLRDPRSVAVSYYHHCHSVFGDKNGFNYKIVELMRETLDVCKRENHDRIPFFEKMIYSPIYPRFTIKEFYMKKEHSKNIVFYEHLRLNTKEVLLGLLEKLHLPRNEMLVDQAIARNSLNANTNSMKQNTFVRRGEVDGWKHELTEKEQRYLGLHMSDIIEMYGYE